MNHLEQENIEQEYYETDANYLNRFKVLHIADDENFLALSKLLIEDRSDGTISIDTLCFSLLPHTKLNDQSYDAIITDYMPSMSGTKLLSEVRTHHPTIPYILFTSAELECVTTSLCDLDVDYYLKKEYSLLEKIEELVKIIEVLISFDRVNKYLIERGILSQIS